MSAPGAGGEAPLPGLEGLQSRTPIRGRVLKTLVMLLESPGQRFLLSITNPDFDGGDERKSPRKLPRGPVQYCLSSGTHPPRPRPLRQDTTFFGGPLRATLHDAA